MRILHLGDVVGKPGRRIIAQAVKGLVRTRAIDLVSANAENAAGGSGLTPEIYHELQTAGVQAFTLGDHIYRRKEICPVLENGKDIVKPANFPSSAPGKDYAIVRTSGGVPVAFISLMGRVFMKPVDCPFAAADRVLAALPSEIKVIVVDIHAEATSDKQLMARYLDGKVSAVLGTHTHVPTADECLLPQGTAFQCDIGMCGPHDGILGRQYERVLETTCTFYPTMFDVATGDVRLNGAIVEIDETTGRARKIERLCVDEREAVRLERMAAGAPPTAPPDPRLM